jgi:hypothetical protein
MHPSLMTYYSVILQDTLGISDSILQLHRMSGSDVLWYSGIYIKSMNAPSCTSHLHEWNYYGNSDFKLLIY